MADTCSPQELPPGHLQSPLFKLIPTEVRLDIYRHTFDGSKVALQLQPRAISFHRPLPVGGRRSVFCTRGRCPKYQLLLTCRQIYNEALAVYWSETIVCNHNGYFSRGLFFERIPDFAKLHIKHLRYVQTDVNPGVKALRGIAFSKQASFAEALDAFPKLKTCSIREGVWEKRPSKAVEEALVRHPQVHLLKTCPEVEEDPERIWGTPIHWGHEMAFIDFTTGMEYTTDEYMWSQFTMDDEEGFQHVMELQPSEKAGGNGEA